MSAGIKHRIEVPYGNTHEWQCACQLCVGRGIRLEAQGRSTCRRRPVTHRIERWLSAFRRGEGDARTGVLEDVVGRREFLEPKPRLAAGRAKLVVRSQHNQYPDSRPPVSPQPAQWRVALAKGKQADIRGQERFGKQFHDMGDRAVGHECNTLDTPLVIADESQVSGQGGEAVPFDDEAWVIRYLVADTSKWLGGRDVLISLYSLGQADWDGKTLPVTVTKEQVRNSPVIDSDLQVSRQYERSYLGIMAIPTTGAAADCGARASIRAPCRSAWDWTSMTATRATCARRRAAMAIMTRICAAAIRCAGITWLPPTARSATSKVSCWMMPHGRFAT